MITYLKNTSVYILLIVFVAVLAVIFLPRLTFAEAGQSPGGAGGCSDSNFCSSFGAVWRYRTTNSNVNTILGLYNTTVTVTGCQSYGGYFEYVLLGKNGNNDVRSWAIGRTNIKTNDNTYRSVKFRGGQTAYLPSVDNGTLPPMLTDDTDYSWSGVEKAFNAMPTSQKNGYLWNSTSRLGWFCYANFNYDLTPTISTNPTKSVTAGGTVNAIGAVNNSGPTGSRSTDWQISQIIVPKGQAIPTASGGSASDPKTFYGSSGFSPVDSSATTFSVGLTSFSPRTVTVPDLPLGTHLCFTLSIKPFNQTTTDWRHSVPKCVVISKKPIAQILGGDLRAGAAFTGSGASTKGSIQTSVTVKAGKTYGSWGEYGLIALGSITGAASGSAYSGGLSCVGSCVNNTLSFTNSSATAGKYTSTTSIPDVAASFGINSSTPQFSSLADATRRRVETSSSDITISGGTIQKGDWLVINAPTKTVTITGDITYVTTPLQAISDIPQLIIIANKINIEGNVGQVDAWLIASGATGSVNTCSASGSTQLAPTDGLTILQCNTPLVINGPVMAKTLYLRRTAGADNAALIGDPAEKINLRPDTYLWAMAQSSRSSRLETTYVSELPPRF